MNVFDSSKAFVAQAFADQNGRFTLHVFAGTSYRLLAVWQGNTTEDATSAIPMDIRPDSSPLSLRLTLTQPGNAFFDEQRQGIGSKR